MMEQKLDCGVRKYPFAGGVLCCNPTDPNLYARFLACVPEFRAAERQLRLGLRKDLLSSLQQADRRMKALLEQIFPGNDFDQLLRNINLLAIGENGQWVITNLLETLEPVLQEGAEAFAQAQTDRAVAAAKERRGGMG